MTKTAKQKSSQVDVTNPLVIAQSNDACAGEILIDLAIASAGADEEFTPPAVIKLAPRGKVQTRDGRAYDFDPELLVARFEKDEIDIAGDLEHSLSSFVGDKKQGAVAWATKLEARDDGLYAHVDWLERGIAALKARTHRYISPTFKHDQFGKATWMHSFALVASPALANMPAVASADPHNHSENNPMSVKLAQLAAALGVTTDASEDAMLAALNAKLANTVDKAVHEETLASLKSTTDELAKLNADIRKTQIDDMLDEALKDKKIVPAQRESYEKLCAQEGGIEQVQALLAATTPTLKPSGLDGQDPAAEDSASLSADDQAVIAQLGLSEEEFKKANSTSA
jgi:phage I-like protein